MIGIYYIATGRYNEYFQEFYDSLSNWYPDEEKKLVLFTDIPENYKEKNLLYNPDIRYIPHQYWPIPTLFKMTYIKNHLKDNIDFYDKVFYFNANIKINKKFSLESDKFLIVRHHYCEANCKYDSDSFSRVTNYPTPKDSLAYIPEDKKYTYHQACFFGGGGGIMLDMCKWVDHAVKEDLSRGLIPEWHDESYLNKWILDNPELCHELPPNFLKPEHKKGRDTTLILRYSDITEDLKYTYKRYKNR